MTPKHNEKIKKLADELKKGFVFDTPEHDINNDNEIEENEEENIEIDNQVEDLLKVWDKDSIVKEVEEEKERIRLTDEWRATTMNYYDGETSFDQLRETMEPIDEEGNVYFKITKTNPTGRKITALCTVLYNHIGYLEYDEKPFESSHYDKKPVKVNLLEGPIIPGLLAAFLCMREGESANIIIKPSYAYGNLPVLGLHGDRYIPEKSEFFYHVRIVKAWEESELNQALKEEEYNNIELPMDYKLKLIEKHKEIANQLFKEDQVRDAVIRYKAAIKLLDDLDYTDLIADNEQAQLLLCLLQNAGIALNKLEMYKSASKHLKRAHFLEPKSVKVLYHLAKARASLKDYSNALDYIKKADKLSPNQYHINQLKYQIDKELATEKSKRDEIMLKMSKAFK